MEILLIFLVMAEFFYIIYQDHANRQEREKLQLKFLSKNSDEYKRAVEPPPKEAESVPENYKPVEEVPFNKLIEAEDKI